MASPSQTHVVSGSTGPMAWAIARALSFAALLAASTCAAAFAPELSPARFNDGTEVDTSAVGTRLPLLLVHGLGGSNEGWESFLRAYERHPAWRGAFKPYTFRYSTDAEEVRADPAAPRSIPAVARALRDAMQVFYDRRAAAPYYGFGGKRVLVLAHSMGGLVARSMMQEHAFLDGQRGGEKVLRLVTLGTPHHGSPLMDTGLALGLEKVDELSDAYPGFLAQLTWTNYDGLDLSGGRCNPWLASLNSYAPATGGRHGRCGTVAPDPLWGYYEKILAYGTSALQSKDVDLRVPGVYKPGSDSALWLPSQLLLNLYGRRYPNDGIVPMASAQFAGAPLAQRRAAYACDHRYIKRGYTELVRSATGAYHDTAFCAAGSSAATTPSGVPGGYAVAGSIFDDPGGIAEILRTQSQAERVFDWAEQAYAGHLQPAGAASGLWEGYIYRWYPATSSYVGVRDGNVYYMGPASNGDIQFMGTLADFAARAQGAGF
ncbi:MAG TPA: hypothetical protein VGE20_19325 [Ramlibacter sp.]